MPAVRPRPSPPRRNTPPEFERVRSSVRPESGGARAVAELEQRWVVREQLVDTLAERIRTQDEEIHSLRRELQKQEQASWQDDEKLEAARREVEAVKRGLEALAARIEQGAAAKAEAGLEDRAKASGAAAGAEGADEILKKGASGLSRWKYILAIVTLVTTAFHSWLTYQSATATPPPERTAPTPARLPEANPNNPAGAP